MLNRLGASIHLPPQFSNAFQLELSSYPAVSLPMGFLSPTLNDPLHGTRQSALGAGTFLEGKLLQNPGIISGGGT